MRIAALLFVSLFVVACSKGESAPTSHDLAVELELLQSQAGDFGASCSGRSGYDDIHSGASVVVKDENSTIIGTASLGAGKVETVAGLGTGTKCKFRSTVGGLPAAKFYSVEVSHRGSQTYSYEELEKDGWRVELTLGRQ